MPNSAQDLFQDLYLGVGLEKGAGQSVMGTINDAWNQILLGQVQGRNLSSSENLGFLCLTKEVIRGQSWRHLVGRNANYVLGLALEKHSVKWSSKKHWITGENLNKKISLMALLLYFSVNLLYNSWS